MELELEGERFRWDAEKEASNIVDHGITFEEAAQSVLDDHLLVRFDKENSSAGQERYTGIG